VPAVTALAHIARLLAGYEPAHSDMPGLKHAAVALVLREDTEGTSVLFIERAAHSDDPWSGDLGFPGGKVDATDAGPRATAERETREELGLDLGTACYLGRLSDIIGAHLPVRVSCFIYGTDSDTPFRFSDEVRDAFWVPLAELADPRRHVTASVRFGEEAFERPAIRLPVEGKPVLWGITYRLVMQFLELAAHGPSPLS